MNLREEMKPGHMSFKEGNLLDYMNNDRTVIIHQIGCLIPHTKNNGKIRTQGIVKPIFESSPKACILAYGKCDINPFDVDKSGSCSYELESGVINLYSQVLPERPVNDYNDMKASQWFP